MPLPRLADHLDTADGPSDAKGEKDAKRQRSEPTTPISTSSRPPHEYDEVMGITPMKPREAERFEERIESKFQDAEEIGTGETGEELETRDHGVGGFHGGFGSATLRECLNRINQSRTDAPATCHSGVNVEKSPDPPHRPPNKASSLRPCRACLWRHQSERYQATAMKQEQLPAVTERYEILPPAQISAIK